MKKGRRPEATPLPGRSCQSSGRAAVPAHLVPGVGQDTNLATATNYPVGLAVADVDPGLAGSDDPVATRSADHQGALRGSSLKDVIAGSTGDGAASGPNDHAVVAETAVGSIALET